MMATSDTSAHVRQVVSTDTTVFLLNTTVFLLNIKVPLTSNWRKILYQRYLVICDRTKSIQLNTYIWDVEIYISKHVVVRTGEKEKINVRGIWEDVMPMLHSKSISDTLLVHIKLMKIIIYILHISHQMFRIIKAHLKKGSVKWKM